MKSNDILHTPVPHLASNREKRIRYRAHPIDISHALHDEPCMDIRTAGIAGENFYHREDNPPYHTRVPHSIPQLYLRNTVAEKLVRINNILAQDDLELYVFDGYRPIEVQNYFHDVWFPEYVRCQHPDWSETEVWAEVELYWAKGTPSNAKIDPLSPPPHSTGGAIDLTIRRKSGEHLFFGTMFDDMHVSSFTDYYETTNVTSFSEEEGKRNRRLLYWLMINEGFQNNATEWWHFSYGDQMWALFSGEKEAFYSVANV